jgi:hypothetical protein
VLEEAAVEGRQFVNVAIAIVALTATAGVIWALWANRFDTVVTDLVVKNFAAIIGLPFAFIAAFIVVALFRQGDSPIEFKGLGLEFKGASGEVILWLLCFLAISGAIKLLWKN